MSDIITYPEDGITYNADDAAGYLTFRSSGVYNAEDDFVVTAAGQTNVQISAGQAWVKPSRWLGRSIIMKQASTLTLPAADANLGRVDRVILRYDSLARKTTLAVLTGTPASTPTAPALTRSAQTYELCLAQISRPAGSTAITASDITDTRADAAVCGVMQDSVGGGSSSTVTAEQIREALGFSPVPAQLPYTIVYDQSYVGTGTQQDYIGNSRTITLHGDYDAVGVITTGKSNYPVGTEKARQCLLKELVTLESPITAFCQNYITLKGLPATLTSADKLGMTGLIVIYNRWATSDTSVSYKDRQLRLTDNTTTNNYGTYSWNNASNQYHVFGITLNSSILPVSN